MNNIITLFVVSSGLNGTKANFHIDLFKSVADLSRGSHFFHLHLNDSARAHYHSHDHARAHFRAHVRAHVRAHAHARARDNDNENSLG